MPISHPRHQLTRIALNARPEILLLESIRQGDHNAFQEFYLAHWRNVFTATFRLVRSEELAKDLVQEAFIKIWEKRHTIDPEANLLGYLHVTIKNSFLNHIRNEELVEDKLKTYFNGKQDHPGPHEQVVATELSSLIDSVVVQMPEGMKKIWYMSRTENLSTDQIASALNISPLTVKKQLTNALRILRSQLRNF